MTTKIKFLLLIFVSFTIVALMIMLFMATDYAQSELAYFRQYPYQEMAARNRITIITEKPLGTAVVLPQHPPLFPVAKVVEIPQKTPLPQLLQEAVPSSPEEIKQAPPLPSSPVRESSRSTQKKTPVTRQKTAPIAQTIPPKQERMRPIAHLGYQAYARQDFKSAIQYFEQALRLTPHHPKITLQLAYAHKKMAHNKEAVHYFIAAIDQMNPKDVPFTLRREVEQLENQFDMTGYVIFRDNSSRSRFVAGPDLTRSQMGLEVSYQPPGIGYRNGRKLQVYSRLLSSTEVNSLTPVPDSLQGGIGIRWKPLSEKNLILSTERLIKVGDFARNDWMIRAGFSHDYNSDYQADKNQWWSYSIYLDAALINPASPDIYLTSQVTGGYNIPLKDSLVVQPRLTGHISWQKDSFHTANLLEAGPGINIRYYFNDTKYEAYRSYIDLTVEYRLKLSGNSIGKSGWVTSLQLHF